jgi:hypothetical protein
MKIKSILITIGVSVVITLFGCTKEDEPISNADILIASQWRLTGAFSSMSGVPLDECSLDDVWKFSEPDGFLLLNNATCYDGEPAQYIGNWVLSNVETTLTLEIDSSPISKTDFVILELTSTQMKLRFADTQLDYYFEAE